jgi:hypothetical protein
MMTNKFEKKNACSQWEGSACTHDQSSFFLFERGGRERGNFCFFSLFPMCSHQVLRVFPNTLPNMFPIAPQLYYVWFCPKFNTHVYKLKMRNLGEHICLYFTIGGQKRCFYWGMPNVPKTLLMGQTIWLL